MRIFLRNIHHTCQFDTESRHTFMHINIHAVIIKIESIMCNLRCQNSKKEEEDKKKDKQILTKRHDFPHQDAEAPDVGLGGKKRVDEGLRRHPPYRQGVPAVSRLDHLAVLVGEPRHAKIRDLAELVVVHQYVTCRQVSMDDLQSI